MVFAGLPLFISPSAPCYTAAYQADSNGVSGLQLALRHGRWRRPFCRGLKQQMHLLKKLNGSLNSGEERSCHQQLLFALPSLSERGGKGSFHLAFICIRSPRSGYKGINGFLVKEKPAWLSAAAASLQRVFPPKVGGISGKSQMLPLRFD